jgi:hypothetical protein
MTTFQFEWSPRWLNRPNHQGGSVSRWIRQHLSGFASPSSFLVEPSQNQASAEVRMCERARWAGIAGEAAAEGGLQTPTSTSGPRPETPAEIEAIATAIPRALEK